MDRNDDSPEMRALLAQLCRDRKVTMKGLSLAIKRNHAYVREYLEEGTPRRMHPDDVALIAGMLGVTAGELKAGQLVPGSSTKSPPTEKPVDTTSKSRLAPYASKGNSWPSGMGGQLPKLTRLLGVVQDGRGVFVENGKPFGMVETPPGLEDVAEHYALPVPDETMMRALTPGSIVYPNPRVPPKQGDLVVILYAPEEDGKRDYIIREYVRRTEKQLVLLQHNPEKEIRVDSEGTTLHCVNWSNRR